MLLSPKYIPRLAAIVGLFTRYGLRDVAKQQGLIALCRGEPELPAEEVAERKAHAVGFRKRLVELGPAYVKLGQVLSTRPDLLPEPYIRELERLQDDVGPIPFEDVEQIIEEELGGRISKLFDFVRSASRSARRASARCTRRELRGGREVIVKVQRPNIRGVAGRRPRVLPRARGVPRGAHQRRYAHRRGRRDPAARARARRRAGLPRRSAQRRDRSGRRSPSSRALLVPKVIEAYTTERVLTMERVHGVKVDAVSPIARLEHDFTPVADELTRAYLKGITIDGFFHADPHPGNVFVVLPGTREPAHARAGRRARSARRSAAGATPLARIEVEARAAAPRRSPTTSTCGSR